MFKINIDNFRGYQNQSLEFSRVNILIGENSGGKSSLLKLLLVLKQTLDNPTESNLKLSGDFTDVGNFEGAVYYGDKSRTINIGFESQTRYHEFVNASVPQLEGDSTDLEVKKIREFYSRYKDSKTSISFRFSEKLDDHNSIKTKIENDAIGSVEIIQKSDSSSEDSRQLRCDIKYNLNGQQGVLENCGFEKKGFLTLLEIELKDLCIKKFGKDFFYFYYSIAYLLVFQNYVSSNVQRIKFVNPIISPPKRFYFREDKKATYKLIDIEKFLNVLSDKSLTIEEYNQRITLLNNLIKKFGIAEEINVIQDKVLPVLALNVKTKDFWSNITDVGYGVSLQIPILFQALLSEHFTPRGETILIEQPEVHLHPSLQSKFIDTLLSVGSKNTYFIETHSEHLVRKLQVMVRNNTHNIKPEDVTIHYFRRDVERFTISSHRIQESGKLNPNFPKGFFDNSYALIKELL